MAGCVFDAAQAGEGASDDQPDAPSFTFMRISGPAFQPHISRPRFSVAESSPLLIDVKGRCPKIEPVSGREVQSPSRDTNPFGCRRRGFFLGVGTGPKTGPLIGLNPLQRRVPQGR